MHIPAAYAATLSAVRASFPGAMIAGGCLRDLDNDRPVKDVDIFLPDCGSHSDVTLQIRETLPTAHYLAQALAGYENWATAEVVGVFDMKAPDLDYQLIALSAGAETILPRLDFGICQIGFDGSGIERTFAYLGDQANQTFTLVRSDDAGQRDRSIKRFERLSAKYPGWTFVDQDDPLNLAV